MKCEENIQILFQQEKYLKCLEILKEERKYSDKDEFIINMNLIYLYEFILVESTYSDEEFQLYIGELTNLLRDNCKKYKQNANFLFYLSYIASSYAEFYMNLTEDDTKKMACKALKLDPDNLMYKWLFYSTISYKNAIYEKERKLCAKLILQNNNYIYRIKEMLLVGNDLLNILRKDISEIEEF